MKVYLIFVAISLIAGLIINAELNLYCKRNFRALWQNSHEERILGWVKWSVMTLLILPNLITLFSCLFANNIFLETVDSKLSKNERFERISKDGT